MEKLKGGESALPKQLYIARWKDGLYIKELSDSFKISTFKSYDGATCFCLSQDNKKLAIGSSKAIDIVDLSTFAIESSIPISYLQELIISPLNTFIVAYARHSQSKLSQVTIYELKSGKKVVVLS